MSSKLCHVCGLENDPETRSCLRCGASLPAVKAPPQPGQEPDARTVVLRTFTSQMEAQVVESHLEEANISVVVAADDCGGLYPFLTPVHGIHLLIKASDLPRAEEALREIEEQFGIKTAGAARGTGVPPPKPSPHLVKLCYFALGALVGGLAYYAVTLKRQNYTGTDDRDFNGDGRADAWWTYRRGELISSSRDRNFDGHPDATESYLAGWPATGEADENFDGKPDTWWSYTNNLFSLTRADYDFDGQPDSETRWTNGVVVETVFWSTNQPGNWRRDFYTNSVLRVTYLDRDRDGVPDERIVFDSFGTLLRVEPIR